MNKSSLSKCIFLYLISFSSLCFSQIYYSQIETHYKAGNNRQIGRLSILVPLWEKEDNLLYFNGIGMMDSQKACEGNFALGFRKIWNEGILGGYGYLDRRKSASGHIHHQSTLGIEWLGERFETRVNSYIPLSDKKTLRVNRGEIKPQIYSGSLVFIETQNRKVEKALYGVDVELGVKAGKLPMMLYGAGYHFFQDGYRNVTGVRGRIQYRWNNWLTVGGELQKDNARGTIYYMGAEIRFGTGNKELVKPWSLLGKMTQMPIRDVDVVVEVKDENLELDRQKPILIDNFEQFIAALKEQQKNAQSELTGARKNKKEKTKKIRSIYAIVNDIQAQDGYLHIPVGTEAQPFKGKVLGVELNKDEAGKLKSAQLYERRIIDYGKLHHSVANNVGLFGVIQDSEISHLTVRHENMDAQGVNIGGVVGKSLHSTLAYIHHEGTIYGISRVGGLVGSCVQSVLSYNSHEKGLVAGADSTGGIVGESIDSTVENNINRGIVTVRKDFNFSIYQDLAAIGGIAGRFNGQYFLRNNHNKGIIKGLNKVGGIAGIVFDGHVLNNQNFASIFGTKMVGGVVGEGSLNTIQGNYNHGQVEGDEFVGGILGNSLKRNTITDNVNIAKIGTIKAFSVGGIVGVANNQTLISNCKNQGEIVGKEVVGGIAGNLLNLNTIQKSQNEGAVKGVSFVAGIGNLGTSNTLTQNKNTGMVHGESEHIGGIAGYADKENNIELCTNQGNISGNGDVGGIAGRVGQKNNFAKNENFGKVEGSQFIGGIIGYLDEANIIKKNESEVGEILGIGQSSYIGGIVGFSKNMNRISNCVNTSKVSGQEAVGGVIGHLHKSNFLRESRNESVVEGTVSVGGVIGSLYEDNQLDNVENLGNVIGKNVVGGIIGNGKNKNKIIKCINTGKVFGNDIVGGIVAYLSEANELQNNYNTGDVEGKNGIGGIVGALDHANLIENSINMGRIKGEYSVGGISGNLNNDNTIQSCENKGKIFASGGCVGGIIGYAGINNIITLAVNLEEVNGFGKGSGGIVGNVLSQNKIILNRNEGNVDGYMMVGGILGYGNMLNELSQNINKFLVNGTQGVGGIAGGVKAANEVVNNQNHGEIKGLISVGGILGLSQIDNEILKNHNSGKIEALNKYAGGIIAAMETEYEHFAENFNSGNVIGKMSGDIIGQVKVKVDKLLNQDKEDLAKNLMGTNEEDNANYVDVLVESTEPILSNNNETMIGQKDATRISIEDESEFSEKEKGKTDLVEPKEVEEGNLSVKNLKATTLINALSEKGWQKVSQKGSHVKLSKNKNTIIIPVHSREVLGKGLAYKILKLANE